ncbi:MAG: nucleotide exchange factor GrpE [Candidatus Nealsonbacteria bacterium]|nr:nucleotide exchange factor GrpE [Candidatus Nealsonbacteria bacterium]
MTEDKKEKQKEDEKNSVAGPPEEKVLAPEECQKQRDEYLAGWQRARADLLNYKKEEMERFEQVLMFAGGEFVLKILPILDNFNLIEKKLPEDLKKDDNIKGILRLKNQIEDFLKIQGVEEIKTAGNKFDPNFQEAAEMVEAEGAESGTVLEEIQKGYMINNRVLRPAKVRVVK